MIARITLLLGFLLALAVAAEQQTQGRAGGQSYIVGISPFLAKKDKDEVYRKLVSFIVEEIPLSSRVAIYDAFNLKTVSTFALPELRAFQSPKTRANQLKEQLSDIRKFLATAHQPPQTSNMTFEAAIRLPQFLDFLTAQQQGASGANLLLIGSPLYLDEKEPAFAMVNGLFPSDGHLHAARADSIYGLKERSSALRGLVAHWAFPGDPWLSQAHQDRVHRFWSLFFAGQQGQLRAFAGDLPTVFGAALNPSSKPAMFTINANDKKIEMLRVMREVAATDWLTGELNPNRVLPRPSKTVGPMKIGIRWGGDIDLDLYAAPEPGREALYFENTRIPEGYYFKDHRSSPDRDYEFVEFEAPIDAWKANARINFYEGHKSGGASGEIRIEFDGRIYTGAFHLAADSGNKGRTGRGQADYWVTIDIPHILKLKEPIAAR